MVSATTHTGRKKQNKTKRRRHTQGHPRRRPIGPSTHRRRRRLAGRARRRRGCLGVGAAGGGGRLGHLFERALADVAQRVVAQRIARHFEVLECLAAAEIARAGGDDEQRSIRRHTTSGTGGTLRKRRRRRSTKPCAIIIGRRACCTRTLNSLFEILPSLFVSRSLSDVCTSSSLGCGSRRRTSQRHDKQHARGRARSRVGIVDWTNDARREPCSASRREPSLWAVRRAAPLGRDRAARARHKGWPSRGVCALWGGKRERER